jgi:hypothetical protein
MASRNLQRPAPAIAISPQNPAHGRTGDHEPADFSPAVATPDAVVPGEILTRRSTQKVFVPPSVSAFERLGKRSVSVFDQAPPACTSELLRSRVNWTLF